MIHASFVDEVLIPTIVLSAIITVITLFSISRARRARQAYEKGGVIGFAENLKMGYLKAEASEGLDTARVLDLTQQKMEKRKAGMARLDRFTSLKATLIAAGAMMAALALVILADAMLDLPSGLHDGLIIGVFALFILFMIARLGISMTQTMFKTSNESILKLLERARADLASGVAPSAPVTIPAAGFEPTYIDGAGRDWDSVRTELGALFGGSRFKPWMDCAPVFILLGVQLFLAAGDKPLERSYDNPWLMFSLFAMATVLTFLVAVRIVYFAMVSAYTRKGPEGLREMDGNMSSNPGVQVLLVLTTIGILPSVFGFVFFFACSSWPGSLLFHAVSLSHIFYFQLKLGSFADRMADNVMYLAGCSGNDAAGSASLIKVARRMFSR